MSKLPVASPSADHRAGKSPALLVRTMAGHIALWSPAMERRYGYTPGEAWGAMTHKLLRTSFRQSQHEIEVELLERKSWSGGLVHRHADGQPVMTVHHWQLLEDGEPVEPVISEVHSDIALPDGSTANQIADIIGLVGHELSQPLTAMTHYVEAAELALQLTWPVKGHLSQALTGMSEQMTRIRDGMALFHKLAESLHHSDQAPASEGATHSDR